MDPHVRWLRRRLLRGLAPIVAGWLVVSSTLAFGLLAVVLDGGLVAAAPWALVVGQVVLAAGLARAAFGNPFGVGYLRHHRQGPQTFDVAAPDEDGEDLDAFEAHQLEPLATLISPVDGEPLFDLLLTPRATVTAARNRRTGSVSLLTRLADDRILLTDALSPVPCRRLLANPCASGALADLVAAHHTAVQVMGQRGVGVVADDGFVLIEALALEHDAVTELGPFLAPFLALGLTSAPLRFLVALDREELVERQVVGHEPASAMDLLGI